MPRQLSRTHRIALYWGLPLALIGAAALTAHAFDVSWIQPNATLSASKLAANLKALATGPLFCGATNANLAGGFGGYGDAGGVDKLCQAMATAPGCNGSPTAHMCTANEIIRSAQVKGAANVGGNFEMWYVTGELSDCKGGTSNSFTDYGHVWYLGRPETRHCSELWQAACCDLPQ